MPSGQIVSQEQKEYIRLNLDLLPLRLIGRELGLSSKTVAKYVHIIRHEQMGITDTDI